MKRKDGYSCWICHATFPTKKAANRHQNAVHCIKVDNNLTITFIKPWSAFHKKGAYKT